MISFNFRQKKAHLPEAAQSMKQAVNQVVMIIFHNDLRLHDNATLNKAAEITADAQGVVKPTARILPVYAARLSDNDVVAHPAAQHKNLHNHQFKHQNRHKFSQKRNAKHSQAYFYNNLGEARQRFLFETLKALDQSLSQLGSQLVFLSSALPQSQQPVFMQLCQLIERTGVTDICVSHTADYNQNHAYDSLKKRYPAIVWHRCSTATLYSALPTSNLPKVFSQFRKQIETNHDLLNMAKDMPLCVPPTQLAPLPKGLNPDWLYQHSKHYKNQSDTANPLYSDDAPAFVGGETNALSHLSTYFNAKSPSSYKTTRNALDEWTHSTKFSAWLANGSLSVKAVLNRLRHYQQQVVANDSTYWIWFELLWREYFYWYAVEHGHRLFLFQGIQNKKPLTSFYASYFQCWKEGSTPFPIVNACMKQLKQTGYMSNRGRQLAASCLIYELGIDWRYGATYFEQHLLDYDVASNWGNWQYLAGVGADHRGGRHFNLEKQTQQYDANGEFIKKWQGNAQTNINSMALLDW